MSNASYPNPGIKWGLIAGAVGVAASILLYYSDLPLLFSLKFRLLILATYGILGLLAGLQKKRQQGGFIGFKGGLQPIFTTFVIGTLISTIFTFVLANSIDPTIPEQMKQASIASFHSIEKMQRMMGASQEDIDKALNEIKAQDLKITPAGSFLSYLNGLLFCFIISAILSLIIRKKQLA